MSDNSTSYSVQQLPETDRPRERLLRHGPEVMTTAELIAILLGSGMKGTPVLKLAQEIVSRFAIEQLPEATVAELCEIKGLGPAKALQLKAAFNLGLRVARKALPAKLKIEHPSQAYAIVKEELEREKRELFVVIFQDTKGYVIGQEVVSIGTLSHALVHPREVFYPAIRHHAASIIVAHNHPSGDPTPSQQDYDVTDTLVKSGQLIGIPVNDHIIIGHGNFVSLRQLGREF